MPSWALSTDVAGPTACAVAPLLALHEASTTIASKYAVERLALKRVLLIPVITSVTGRRNGTWGESKVPDQNYSGEFVPDVTRTAEYADAGTEFAVEPVTAGVDSSADGVGLFPVNP